MAIWTRLAADSCEGSRAATEACPAGRVPVSALAGHLHLGGGYVALPGL